MKGFEIFQRGIDIIFRLGVRKSRILIIGLFLLFNIVCFLTLGLVDYFKFIIVMTSLFLPIVIGALWAGKHIDKLILYNLRANLMFSFGFFIWVFQFQVVGYLLDDKVGLPRIVEILPKILLLSLVFWFFSLVVILFDYLKRKIRDRRNL